MFRCPFRCLHENRYIPAVAQFRSLKKRAIDNKNGIGWCQLRFLFDGHVVFKVKGLRAIQTVPFRPQWGKEERSHRSQIACIVVVAFG